MHQYIRTELSLLTAKAVYSQKYHGSVYRLLWVFQGTMRVCYYRAFCDTAHL